MTSTTIKVSATTHSRLRRLASAAGTTQGRLIESLLDAHEEANFWRAIEALDPDEVREALAQDGDQVAQDYQLEDAALEA